MADSFLPHSRPWITPEDEQAVLDVLRSGYLSRGRACMELEDRLATAAGRRDAVAVSSGHAALYLALRVSGVREDDRVVLPSYCCSALLNAVRHAGAEGVLVDCNPATGNMDPASLEAALTPGVKAVVLPHMLGLPAPAREVQDLAERAGATLIEDCAQALGSHYAGRPLGSWGRLSIFSLYATKIATSGQGGAVAADDPELVARLRDLTDYDNRPDYRVRYNYALSDLAAALGASQLSRLHAAVQRRRELAARYREAWADLPMTPPPDAEGHMYFRFTLATDRGDRLVEALRARGVEAKRPVFRPLHSYLGMPDRAFPGTEAAHRRLISVPLYPALTDEEAERVIDAVIQAAGEL